MPPTESDRDDLARIIFTATHEFRHQTWEQTSEGWRNRCRDKADDAMAAGWRKVGEDQVVVSRADAERIDPLVYAKWGACFDANPKSRNTKLWHGVIGRLRAALNDPAQPS